MDKIELIALKSNHGDEIWVNPCHITIMESGSYNHTISLTDGSTVGINKESAEKLKELFLVKEKDEETEEESAETQIITS